MIVQICFLGVDSGDLLGSSSVWHVVGVSGAIKVPAVGHHEVEVVIVVDVAGDVLVVLKELSIGDLTIGLGLLHQVVVGLKSLHEFGKDLILSSLSGSNLWMLLSIISSLDFLEVNSSIAVKVKNLKSL